MKDIPVRRLAVRLGAVAALALVASCATPPPPPPPPPPPAPAPTPTPTPIPSRPQPPNGASLSTPVPPVGADGIRLTVNAHLTPAGTTWNLRSALNVAALNCVDPEHASILPAYREFLKKHERKLAAVNKAVDEEFRKTHGARTYRTERDQYMTQVYNYFALPPALDAFCAASVAIANSYMAAPPSDIDAFAAGALPQLEAVFLDFYSRFDAYKIAVADWDTQYGALYGHTQPGYVATAAFAPATVAGDMPVQVFGPVQGPAAVPLSAPVSETNAASVPVGVVPAQP